MLTAQAENGVADELAALIAQQNQADGEFNRVCTLMDKVADRVNWQGLRSPQIRSEAEAHAAVESLLQAVLRRMTDDSIGDIERVRLQWEAYELRRAQVSMQEAVSTRRSVAVSQVRLAMENLRSVDSVAELVTRAPLEAARLGFERCLLSKISDSKWLARSAFAQGDEELADAMIEIGNRTPRVIDSRLVECDVVRQRTSILVTDACHNDRVHPELVRLVRPVAYVAAPIIANGSVVGFLHADAGYERPPVDEFDRDLLDAFSAGLSSTLESLYYREQLDRIRQQCTSVGSSMLEAESESLEPASTSSCLPARAGNQLRAAGALVDRLTRREAEVLVHMANGETNRRIAARLFVSEATIKAHVKQILRKLGAANRAEAVSRYLRAT
jgi:DNA-binding CsgD family transcriptional regulator